MVGWEILIRIAVGEDLDFVFDAVMSKFFGEMVRGGNDVVGIIGVVYHHGPHFGFGGGVG